jgi:methyl-accepting chemotaxis protein
MINKNVSIINDQSSELEESFNGVTSAAVHLANITEDLNEKIERYNT